MLLSFVNTKLRDHFATLEEFCSDYGIEETSLRETLSSVDYHYDETTNQFVQTTNVMLHRQIKVLLTMEDCYVKQCHIYS